MKVIAVIERPAVIRQIPAHLGLPTAAPSFRAPPDPPREWSYEPLLDLPVRRTCLPSRGDRQAQAGDLPVSDPLIV
jgi:hypothetical protein